VQVFPLTSSSSKAGNKDDKTMPSDNDNIAKHQLLHHRNRRLFLTKNTNMKMLDWRTASASSNNSSKDHTNIPRNLGGDRDDHDDDHHNDRNFMQLSNCHLEQWTATVGIGTPAQLFTVVIDTTTADVWVPSVSCQDNAQCLAYANSYGWNMFDNEKSSTFSPLYDTLDEHGNPDGSGVLTPSVFENVYSNGERVNGIHGKDVLHLSNSISIPNQIIGQVSDLSNLEGTCTSAEGVLGLGHDMHSSTNPSINSVVTNLRSLGFKHNIFSLYLDAHGDGASRHDFSQLVLGGVDQRRYRGCIQWHDMISSRAEVMDILSNGQFHREDQPAQNDNHIPLLHEKYWNMKLKHVQIMDANNSDVLGGHHSPDIAILDSSSTFIVGPNMAVAKYAEVNNAVCYLLEPNGNLGFNVDCMSDSGFDVALVGCDGTHPIAPLNFVVDEQTYSLTKEDMLADTGGYDQIAGNEVCILRVAQGGGNVGGWILGAPFFNKVYTAFDFDNTRVGFAYAANTASGYDEGFCEEDKDLFPQIWPPTPTKDAPKECELVCDDDNYLLLNSETCECCPFQGMECSDNFNGQFCDQDGKLHLSNSCFLLTYGNQKKGADSNQAKDAGNNASPTSSGTIVQSKSSIAQKIHPRGRALFIFSTVGVGIVCIVAYIFHRKRHRVSQSRQRRSVPFPGTSKSGAPPASPSRMDLERSDGSRLDIAKLDTDLYAHEIGEGSSSSDMDDGEDTLSVSQISPARGGSRDEGRARHDSTPYKEYTAELGDEPDEEELRLNEENGYTLT